MSQQPEWTRHARDSSFVVNRRGLHRLLHFCRRQEENRWWERYRDLPKSRQWMLGFGERFYWAPWEDHGGRPSSGRPRSFFSGGVRQKWRRPISPKRCHQKLKLSRPIIEIDPLAVFELSRLSYAWNELHRSLWETTAICTCPGRPESKSFIIAKLLLMVANAQLCVI